MVDFVLSSCFLVVLMMWYHYSPPLAVLLLPLFVLLVFAASLGVGMWIAALTVEYRDFRIVVPFVVQFGLYISPVGFRSSIVPAKFRLLYALNPMVGTIDGFRWCLLGDSRGIYWPSIGIAVLEVAVILITGIRYFRKTERTFADVI
jgi:lipopolysaccharide transport system permease protein